MLTLLHRRAATMLIAPRAHALLNPPVAVNEADTEGGMAWLVIVSTL